MFLIGEKLPRRGDDAWEDDDPNDQWRNTGAEVGGDCSTAFGWFVFGVFFGFFCVLWFVFSGCSGLFPVSALCFVVSWHFQGDFMVVLGLVISSLLQHFIF